MRTTLAIALIIALTPAIARSQPAPPPVVPMPLSTMMDEGSFTLPQTVTIDARGNLASEAESLAAFLRGRGLRTMRTTASDAAIGLNPESPDAALGSEGYRLAVSPRGIAIEARSPAGIFYGIQTLEQLIDDQGGVLAAERIEDRPRYRWRGIHLDVSRHFFDAHTVERYIDLAARLKLNVFHWHLTDDQGWRLEIKRYPKLTSVGGCRAGSQTGGEGSTATDGKRYCGFYTQAQVRAIVAFADARHVTVVPEIEMPGHSAEAVAAYPWLACKPGDYHVRELWGISNELLCPSAATFTFLDDVVREVAALFPGPYIHIGGDEVPYGAWHGSETVRRLKAREGLHSDEQVQAYFTRRVESIAARYHRRIVGWDDILSGPISKSATVMVWHGPDQARDADKRGNDVILSPDPPLYFDAYQGNPDFEPLAIGGLTTTRMTYAFAPAALAHVIGIQGNLWTEYVPTQSHLFYMLLPRELALAEVAWSSPDQIDWTAFTARAGALLSQFDTERIPFRIPDVTFSVQAPALTLPEAQPVANTADVWVRSPGNDPASSASVTLADLLPGAHILYTLDGTNPTSTSAVYTSPISLSARSGKRLTIVARAAAGGRLSAPSTLHVFFTP